MSTEEIETFYPKNRADWRNWLHKNHETKQSIWLIIYRKSTNIPSIGWSEAVDEALCYGWIDSTKRTIDDQRYMQYYSKRKPKSNWSKINKAKIAKLIDADMMQPAGMKCVEIAKKNGSWIFLDDVENLVIPSDLNTALTKNTIAKQFYQSQSNSIKKQMLYWILSAKRDETRKKRIHQLVEACSQNMRPNNIR